MALLKTAQVQWAAGPSAGRRPQSPAAVARAEGEAQWLGPGTRTGPYHSTSSLGQVSGILTGRLVDPWRLCSAAFFLSVAFCLLLLLAYLATDA